MTQVICWDLDETLGNFKPIEEGRTDIILRKGIKEILEEMQQIGIINVLTTTATRRYAKIALDLGGIRPHFEQVFTCEDVMGWSGKKYGIILPIYDISPENAGHKVMAVGDLTRDRPIDVSDMVFVLDSTFRESRQDTSNLGKIIKQITKRTGSFKEGFEELYKQAEPHPDGYKILESGFKGRCAMNQGGNPKINLIMLSEKKNGNKKIT